MIAECKKKIDEIAQLRDNYDGYGAISVDKQVIDNSLTFLDTLYKSGFDNIDSEDIYPTPYGSIVIDIINLNDEVVSVEIGKHKIGYFSEFINNENISSEGEETDFKNISENLYKVIQVLYKNQQISN